MAPFFFAVYSIYNIPQVSTSKSRTSDKLRFDEKSGRVLGELRSDAKSGRLSGELRSDENENENSYTFNSLDSPKVLLGPNLGPTANNPFRSYSSYYIFKKPVTRRQASNGI